MCAAARAAVSKYQRAIAYANAQAAYARIQHSLGQEFDFGNIDSVSVSELAGKVKTTLTEAEKQLPTPLLAIAGARPKIQLFVDQQSEQAKALIPGVVQALERGGFEVVAASGAGVLRLQVGLTLGDAHAGLRRSQVELSEVGKPGTVYRATLPANPQQSTLAAVGEAAVTAKVGYLREWMAAMASP